MANEAGSTIGLKLAWISKVFAGTWIDPDKLNPYRVERPTPPKPKEQVERESAAAWRLLDKYFGGK